MLPIWISNVKKSSIWWALAKSIQAPPSASEGIFFAIFKSFRVIKQQTFPKILLEPSTLGTISGAQCNIERLNLLNFIPMSKAYP